MADTAIRSASSNSSTTGTAVSVSAPSGTTTGDLVIVAVHVNTQTTIADNNFFVATPTNLINEVKTADATSHTTASFSVTSGRLYMFTVASKTEITADPNKPTISGNGLTISVVPGGNDTTVYDNSGSSRRRVTMYYAVCSSSTSGTITVDYAGQTQVTSLVIVDEIPYGFNPTTPILQSAQNSSPSSSVASITATLASFGASQNATYGGFAAGNGTDTYTVGSGFGQVVQKKDATENNLTVLTEFKSTNDTTVDVSVSPNQAEIGIIAVEIQAWNGGFTEDINDYKPNTTNGHTVSIFRKRIVAGDPSTYNFTSGASGRWAIGAIAISDPDPDRVYDVSPSTSNAANRDNSTTNTLNAPAITIGLSQSIDIVVGFSDDGAGGAMTGPGGYTAQCQPINEPLVILTKTGMAVGTTGTRTVTATTNSPMIALSFSVATKMPLSWMPRTNTPTIQKTEVVEY